MPKPIARAVCITLLIGIASLEAAAQTVAPNDANRPRDETTQAPDPRQDPRSTSATARPGESLSQRLERTEGVIRPPSDLNPDARVRPPVADPGTTRVIPPPGERGGNQLVQPK
jgi:hypothetical protein